MTTRMMLYRSSLCVVIMALWFAGAPVFAQPETNAPAATNAPAGTNAESGTKEKEGQDFQTRVKKAGEDLAKRPIFKNLSDDDRKQLMEFVVGNTLFVTLHELGHAVISEMGLPVLGRPEDAADSFATVGLIRIGSTFTHQVLTDAAKGWFLSDRRDRDTDDTVAFYDEHGLDQQRAYEIVCLMVGSDDEKFKDLADQTKLPKDRQDSCAGDFSNAAYSWDLVLKPHVRTPDQPEADITVVYGEAKGRLEPVAQALKSIGLLEAIAVHTAEAFAWPKPFSLEAQTCGFPNARWDYATHKLVVCYELAADFAELYRAYGAKPMKVRAMPAAKKKRASR
jgi:hypothetical protein